MLGRSSSLSPWCPFALTTVCWWKADVFFLSVSLCFGLCVLILSKPHRNLLLQFPVFTSDAAFSVTTATLFYGANFESQLLPVVLWTGKQTAWKKNTVMAPRVFAIHEFSFHIQFASPTAQRPLKDTALSFCVSHHSALYGPFSLDVVDDGRRQNAFECQHHFSFKLNSRLRTTFRH